MNGGRGPERWARLLLSAPQRRTLRHLRRDVANSPTPARDLWRWAFALVCRPSKLWLAPQVHLRQIGEIAAEEPLRFGVFTNQMFVSPGDRGSLVVHSGARMVAGRDVRIAQSCRVQVGGELRIGHRVRLNHSCFVLASDRVEIGDDTLVGPRTMIIDDDLHETSWDRRSTPQAAPVVIGRRAWIGSNCSILKGVQIGDGAVVGANSVVTDDIPAGALAAGAPAVVKRRDVTWRP